MKSSIRHLPVKEIPEESCEMEDTENSEHIPVICVNTPPEEKKIETSPKIQSPGALSSPGILSPHVVRAAFYFLWFMKNRTIQIIHLQLIGCIRVWMIRKICLNKK